MKKIIIVAIALSAFSATSAFAVDSSDGTLTVEAQTSDPKTNEFSIQLSKNVFMQYDPGTEGVSYSVVASHASGTRTFGSSSGDSSIYYADGTNVDAIEAPTGTESIYGADPDTWTKL
jgi:hypothetical protein